jgi:S-adenosylmethionine hydrolase
MFDRFGNAQTNISKEHLDKIPQRSLLISCRQQTFKWVSHYQQGKDQPALSLLNSDGYLELAVYNDSAERKFGLQSGDPVNLK